MNNEIIILVQMMMALLYPVRAQHLQFGDYSDRLWFLSVPGSPTAPCSTSAGRPIGLRDDYEYTTGIGAHKVHTDLVSGWNRARRICKEEGGYLAIINSVAEANVISGHLNKIGTIGGSDPNFVFIGFHDLFEKGDFVTVHDQSLANAGFTEWAPAQPDNNYSGTERCGSVNQNGRLNDIRCTARQMFICEISV